MDNITHTLVGVALGHALASSPGGGEDTPARNTFRKAVLWTSIVGSNFPDIDVAINPFLKNPHLAGLLEHRGYTHSFLAIPCLGFLAAWIGSRLAKTQVTGKLFGIGCLAVFLHIAADYLNDYGVHPFTPFLNRWFYGDTLFILEPSIWLAVLPLAFLEARNIFTRGLSAIIEMIILGVLWFSAYASPAVAGALSVWAVGMFAAQWFLRREWRGAFALAGIGVCVLVFAICGERATSAVREAFAKGSRVEQIADVVRSPAPGNPMCWRVIAVSSEGDHYIARLGVVNFAPQVFKTEDCFYRVVGMRNPALRDSTLADTSRTHWTGEYSASLEELRQLARKDCQLDALLRFARVPYWTTESAADLRYAYTPGKSFTSVRLGLDQTFCLSWTPPWVPPFRLLGEIR